MYEEGKSKIGNAQMESIFAGISNVCKNTEKIISDISQNCWIQNRTKIVRYEDLAADTETYAKVGKF